MNTRQARRGDGVSGSRSTDFRPCPLPLCHLAGEGWAPPGCTLPKTHHAMTTHNQTIPDRSPPVSTRTAPSAVHQDGGVSYATSASSKIRGRDNITIGTWNTRILRAAGKLQELTYEMDSYRWNILGLCEMRWVNLGETTTAVSYTHLRAHET